MEAKEEALERLFATEFSVKNTKNIISDIYDYFENRLCENCKFMCDEGTSEYCLITKDSIPFDIDDYSCNKWERKDGK